MKPTVVTEPDMKELQHNYNLTVPALVGLCKSTMDDTCCSCMKKKLCNDIGCSSKFGGQGININTQYVSHSTVTYPVKMEYG